MTKDVLFVQGGGEGVHRNWDARLVASLGKELGPNYRITYPLMPNKSDPNVAAWQGAISKALASLGDRVILVVTRLAPRSSSTSWRDAKRSRRSLGFS